MLNEKLEKQLGKWCIYRDECVSRLCKVVGCRVNAAGVDEYNIEMHTWRETSWVPASMIYKCDCDKEEK